MDLPMKLINKISFFLLMSVFSISAFATPLTVFNGWNMLASDDGVSANGFVDPGWGGQAFDAEYLFYKLEGSQLSVGLQTGFNIHKDDGYKHTDGKWYYAGDLALSFDGSASSYEYAVDFGNKARGYNTNAAISAGAGDTDAAGLYSVSTWNNDIHFNQSAPYAMDAGTLLVAANGSNFTEGTGTLAGNLSYYNIFTFDLSNIAGITQTFGLNAHWTMSCGNDEIEGGAQVIRVAEPGSLLLFVFGFLGLMVARRRLRKD
jgi:hypothetical protein